MRFKGSRNGLHLMLIGEHFARLINISYVEIYRTQGYLRLSFPLSWGNQLFLHRTFKYIFHYITYIRAKSSIQTSISDTLRSIMETNKNVGNSLCLLLQPKAEESKTKIPPKKTTEKEKMN